MGAPICFSPFLARLNDPQEQLLHYPRRRRRRSQNAIVLTIKFFYVMGKTLIGELSCPVTGLVSKGNHFVTFCLHLWTENFFQNGSTFEGMNLLLEEQILSSNS